MAPPLDRTATLTPRGSSPSLADELPRVDDALPIDDPERYEQIGEHARGGLGRVVRAIDKRLGRTVAVKELLRHDEWHEARFVREALITARLEHPGIVPVHEAGRWPNGDPYYVMKLVEGRTLKELFAETDTLRDRLGLLPHVIAIADAIGYAHREGVIHRDLKPANVVIGAFGETIVVDWGLAWDRQQDPPELDGGGVVGTPAYMAPEQARGVIDERCDVYAIGAILYELLSGMAPYIADTPAAILSCVAAGPPPRLAGVPAELRDLVHKAMAREPAHRYPNATALAEDLRRYQTGKLVRAHAYSPWQRAKKKLGQHKGVVAVAVASAVTLSAIGVESFRTVVAERDNAQRARAEAEAHARELVLVEAQTSLDKDPTAAVAWLKRYSIGGDTAGVVDILDEARALGVARHVVRAGDWVLDARFTPDGTSLVAVVRDGRVLSIDVASGNVRELGRATSALEELAIAPDGETAITATTLGEVIAWPLHGAGAQHTLVPRGNSPMGIRFDSTGKRFLVDRSSGPLDLVSLSGEVTRIGGPTALWVAATSDGDHAVRLASPSEIVDATTGRSIVTVGGSISYLAVSPTGDAVVYHDKEAVWSVPFTGGAPRMLAPYPAVIKTLAWSPDRNVLAILGFQPDIPLVDLTTGATRMLRGHTDTIYHAEFSRDGGRLLTASDDGTARVWNLADGTSLVLRGHDDDVYRAHFSPDETTVATSSLDGSTRVWPIAPGSARVLVEGAAITGLDVAGPRATVRTADTIARWDLDAGKRAPLFAWPHESGEPSPDGDQLVVRRHDWSLEVRHKTGASTILTGHHALVSQIEWSGDSVYSSSYDGTLRRWDPVTGAGKTLLAGDEPVKAFSVAPDGRIAARTSDALVMIENDTVTPVGDGCIIAMKFEARGRLVVHRCDHSLELVDGDRVVKLDTKGTAVERWAVAPDRIAAAMNDRTILVWDDAGKSINKLRGHTDLVMDVAFSPDGERLASAGYDKTIRVWDLATGRHRVLRGHTGPVERVAWRGPSELVSASDDGTLRVWQAPPRELPSDDEIKSELDAATTAEIDHDRPSTGVTAGT